MSVSLTTSNDLMTNSISVIDKTKLIGLKELCLAKLDAINTIVGLPVATLDSLQKLAESINSDANFLNTSMAAINLKSDLTYVNTQLDNMIKNFLNYDTIETSYIILNLNSTITHVDTSCQSILNIFQYYETILGTDIKLYDVDTKLDNIIQKFLNYHTIDASSIKFKSTSNISYVDTSCQALNHKLQYYEKYSVHNVLTKSDKLTTYLKQLMLMCFYLLYKLA